MSAQSPNPQSPIPNPQSLIRIATLLVASAVGVLAFLYPFFSQAAAQADGAQVADHSQDAPLIFALLTILLLVTVVSSLSSGQLNSKLIAVLGILAAVSAVLRLVPGPGGFSAIFFLPILAGYVYGPTFGFLLGSLGLAASALIGAGIGPWLPFQMFAAGWVGLLSGGLGMIMPARWVGTKGEVAILAVLGMVLGLGFGAVMNLWFWPFIVGGQQSALNWQPGISALETVRRYALFYAVTSAWWDVGRAVGNAVLIILLGWPVLRVLRRFRAKFRFEIE